jgi:tight adherence protein B
MFLAITFFTILLICFAVVTFMMRETDSEKTTRHRLDAISHPQTTLSAKHWIGDYLNAQEPGPFAWLEEMLSDSRFLQNLKLLILQSSSKIRAGTIVVCSASLFLVGFIIANLLTSLNVVAIALGIFVGYLPFGILRIQRNRRISAFDVALPDAIDMCSRALRAGHSMNAAFGILADQAAEPAKTEFGEVFKKQSYGLPLRDALLQMLDRVPSPDLQVFVTSILVQKDTGGNLAELLERTVTVIRERLRIHREIRIQTAQGRLTGWILFLLPPVMLVLLNIVNPGYSAILFHDPVGLKMLYTGIALLVAGGLIIRQIVNGIEV